MPDQLLEHDEFFRRVGYRFLFLLLLLVPLITGGCSSAEVRVAKADSGFLDLSRTDLSNPVRLTGFWLAREADEESLSDLQATTGWQPVAVPDYFLKQGFPSEGSVWYRLDLDLPLPAKQLKGFIQHVNNAHALYVSEPGQPPRRIAASGWPAVNADETLLSRAPVTFILPAATSVTLYWNVANHNNLHGGPFHAPYLGTIDGIDQMLLWRAAEVFALFGMFVLVTVVFLTYWWAHRSELETLATGLLSLTMAIRTVAQSGALELMFPAFMNFEIRILLEAITFLLVPGLIGVFLWSFFPHDMRSVRVGRFVLAPPHMIPDADDESVIEAPRGWRAFNTYAILTSAAVGLVLTAVSIVSSPELTSYLAAAARFFYGVLAVAVTILLVQVVRRRRLMAWAVAVGTFALVAAGVHDILYAGGLIPGTRYMLTYGFFAFVLAQTYALIGRYVYYSDTTRASAILLRDEVELRTRELRAATIAAHAANLAKSHFLSAVSHELRSPLASILGYNRILQEELHEVLEPQHREFFNTVRASGERLTSLVNEILDFARIEAGMIDLTILPVEARDAADEVMGQLFPMARDKGLTLRADFGDVDMLVMADQQRLRQVLLNLVSNAVKFTESGEIVLTAREAELPSTPACAIMVTDTGPGISPDFIPLLFDRFTQEERLYNETQRGTGLGLTISRELVTKMGGTIEVESRLNEGSTFTLILPLAPAEERFAAYSGGDGARTLETASRP